jgi:hypothetical protein
MQNSRLSLVFSVHGGKQGEKMSQYHKLRRANS